MATPSIVLAAVLAAWTTSEARVSALHEFAHGRVAVRAQVEAQAASGAIARVRTAEPRSPDGRAPSLDERVLISGRTLAEGAVVDVVASAHPRATYRNPSPHPEWPQVDPIRTRLVPESIEIVPELSFAALCGRARARVRTGLVATLNEPVLGVVRALVLGDSAVDEESAASVRAAGLTHVLAVSGMHVTLVVGAIVFALTSVFRRASGLFASREPARISAAMGVPLALAYAAFAGGAPSAYRAALSASLIFGLRALGRRPEPWSVIGAASVIYAVADPAALARPAFLLSVAATVAILEPPEARNLPAWIRLLRSSIRASIATAPLSMYCFGNLPWVAVLANVVVVPLASVALLPVATFHAALVSLDPSLGGTTAGWVDALTRAFLGACEMFSSLPGRIVPPLDLVEGIVVLLLCSMWMLRMRAPMHAAAGVLAMLCCIGAEWRLRVLECPTGILRASFLDVGQGDAALIDLPDGRLMAVDFGGAVLGARDPGELVIEPLLAARRRTRIDVAVVTHPHPDHYGGLAAVSRSVPITELWDSGQAEDEDPTGEWSRALAEHRARGTRVRTPPELCSAPLVAGGARVRVLAPCPRFDSAYDPNDNSLVLLLEYGRRRLLLMGDAEAHRERSLLASGTNLRADVIKIGHHGSRTSSGSDFLHAVDPLLAVVSAGIGNRFGHPHHEVVERLGTRAQRLDLTGGAIVSTDGTTISVRTLTGTRNLP